MIFASPPYIRPGPTSEERLRQAREGQKKDDERMRLAALNYAARLREETNGTTGEMLAAAELFYLFLRAGPEE